VSLSKHYPKKHFPCFSATLNKNAQHKQAGRMHGITQLTWRVDEAKGENKYFTSYKMQFTHPPFFIASITLAKNYFTFFSKNNENRK
jgi:hypothetical protein